LITYFWIYFCETGDWVDEVWEADVITDPENFLIVSWSFEET